MSRQFATIVRFLFLLLAVTAVLTLTVHAAPTSQETPRLRFNLEEIPYHPAANNTQGESALSVMAPNILLPWSKVAFQSLRNGNWDIFVGNDDGTGQTAVVSSGNAEIHPHLNRGNTKIVYASNSGGDYEIYTANANGSGQTALTNNTSSDGNPSWSPDGSKIVFEAYRNGEADIYVMNADGTNQVRLTTHPDFDGMPTWSPDGSKIAFVSRRTGGYRIYVMNADGTGQTQLSNQPYSLRPQWSPDGSQIAYDADGDGDGWQDLWRMNANGSSQTLVYNPSGQTDAWASSWSPDGSRIVYTLISFIYYQGNWYWTNAYLDAWGAGLGTTRLSSNGKDWDAAWQTSDVIAPTASINSLPAFQAGTPQITWSGSDSGNSGVASYDVQYYVEGTSTWTAWQTKTTLTQANFAGQPGKTYSFRIRARDAAYNLSNWQISPGQMVLFTWGVKGQITDNVGNPIQNASISTNPVSFFGQTSSQNGFYTTLVAQTATNYVVQWEKTGYGALPSTSYTALPAEKYVDIVLPPADNVVQDGNFESNENNLDDVWILSGTFTTPSLTHDNHTGSFGAQMGYNVIGGPSYNSPTLLYSGAYDSSPIVALSPNQLIHVVWRNNDTGNIYHAEQLSEDTWSTPIRVSTNTTNNTSLPQIQVDSNYRVHITWKEGEEVFYTWRPDSGVWTTPTPLTELAPGDMLFASHLVLHGNKISLIFLKRIPSTLTTSLYAISRNLTDTWLPYETIATGLYNFNSNDYVAVGADSNGTLHVTAGPGLYSSVAYYWQKSLTGFWSQTKSIPIGPGTEYGELLVAKNGEVHFLSWGYNRAIYHTKRSTSGTWSSLYTVTNQETQHYDTKAILTDSNVLQVVWTVDPFGQDGAGWGLYHSYRSNDGYWSPITKLTSSPGQYEYAMLFLQGAYEHSYLFLEINNQLAFCIISPEGEWYEPTIIGLNGYGFGTAVVAGDSKIHSFLYQSINPGKGIYRNEFSFGDEYSSLSQEVTVTNTIQNPYLSFMYKMTGSNENARSGLTVIVNNGISQTVAAEFYENTTDWELGSIDLSPWLEQNITITWRTEQIAGTLPVFLKLDDVAIGSSYTDLWTETAGPVSSLPNEMVTFSIIYGNRSPIPAAGAQVNVTLPNTLQFISAIPAPNTTAPTLSWDVGNIAGKSEPFTIELTLQVKPGAPKLETIQFVSNITNSGSELEKINNQVITSLFIGKLTYLPMVTRN